MQRIANVALGLLMIACGIVLLVDPQDGLVVVAAILGFALVAYGARKLVYYITMARRMAGGLSLLFVAVVALDLGSFALVLIGQPRLSIVLFLVGYNAYAGVIAIARAVESKMFASHWMLTFAHGVMHLALVVACLVFIGSDQIIIAIFCFGLFYGACARLVSAFKRTEIIYIQ